jgi:hypothetical protein
MQLSTPYSGSSIFYDTLVWNAAAYFGFKFDGTPPTSSEAGSADYSNFFGWAAQDTTAPYDLVRVGLSTSPLASTFRDSTGEVLHRLLNGNGGAIDTDISFTISGDRPFTLLGGGYPSPPVTVWRVYSHETDNRIYLDAWVSTGYAVDLATFNIATDLDSDNPQVTFPVHEPYTTSQRTVQGDTFGTNWRPADGVMAFPSYFMMAHPVPNVDFAIHLSYLGVHYSQLSPSGPLGAV